MDFYQINKRNNYFFDSSFDLFLVNLRYGPVAKLADATDLGSVGVTHGGSSPLRPTLFPFVLNSFSHDNLTSWAYQDSARFLPHDRGFSKISPLGCVCSISSNDDCITSPRHGRRNRENHC